MRRSLKIDMADGNEKDNFITEHNLSFSIFVLISQKLLKREEDETWAKLLI